MPQPSIPKFLILAFESFLYYGWTGSINLGLSLCLYNKEKIMKLTGTILMSFMNKELNCFISSHNDFETLLPLACNNWKECQDACFMQQTFTVSHSRKSDDESRVCYRIICKHDFVNTFISEDSLLKECTHIIHSHKFQQDDSSSLCPRSINGNKIIDSYNIIL